MAKYALRRVFQAIPILFILSILLFAMVRAAPGGPLSTAYRNPNVTREQIEILKKQLGLDRPLPVQYVSWLGDMLRGDMGESIKFRRPVSEMIAERIPNTLILVGVSFLVTLIIALPVGILSARKPYSVFDYTATTLTFIGQSVPVILRGDR
jgi:peptide/nickel transport system permease protein